MQSFVILTCFFKSYRRKTFGRSALPLVKEVLKQTHLKGLPNYCNPIRTGVFDEGPNSGGSVPVFIRLFVNLKFGAQLKMTKIYHKEQY